MIVMVYLASNYQPRKKFRHVLWRASLKNAVLCGILWVVYVNWHAGQQIFG